MKHKLISLPQLLCGSALLLFLGACALPNDPARQAVGSVREQKQDIPYQDAETAGNTSLFGFRSLPKRAEAPAVSVSASRSVGEVSQCLQGQLKTRFNLPEDFFQVKNYANKAQTVSLVNPFTKKEGLMLDVEPGGVNSSTIKLYANGATLSKAWQQLPARCGGANAAVLSKAETPEPGTAARSSARRNSDDAAASTAATSRSDRAVRSNERSSQSRQAAASAASGSKTKAKSGQSANSSSQNRQAASGSKTDKKAKAAAGTTKAVKPADKKTKGTQAKDSKAKAKDTQTKAKDSKTKTKDTQAKAKDSKTKAKDNKAKEVKTGKDSKAASAKSSKAAADTAKKGAKKDAAPVKPKPKQKSKS